MGQRQQEAIVAAITDLMNAGEEGEMLCCTLEVGDASIQVMQESINIAPYPSDEEPLDCLGECGATEGVEVELVDWEPGKFAMIGTEDLEIDEVAQLVDRIFTRLLGCDDETYMPTAIVEDLG